MEIPDQNVNLTEVRQRFVRIFGILMAYIPALSIFSFVVKKMGWFGPFSYLIWALAAITFLVLWIWFLCLVYQLANALEMGAWSIPLAVLSVIPLFGFIIAIGLLNRSNSMAAT